MITCCLLLSTILQVRKAVDPREETEEGGTMMIGQAIGLTPRLATPLPTLPTSLVCEMAQCGEMYACTLLALHRHEIES